MSGLEILIVGESKVQNTLLKKRLSPVHQLTVVTNEIEAKEVLTPGTLFKVLILDFKKPYSGPLEVLKHTVQNSIDIKIIGISSESRSEFEPQAIEFGIDYFLPKPLEYESLNQLLRRWSAKTSRNSEIEIPEKADANVGTQSEGVAQNKLPFTTIKRCCYICGYEDVKMHLPIKEGFIEDWSKGLAPYFHHQPGYLPWDFLRSMVAVCPYCCFASSKIEDWAEAPGLQFPYKSDAKKILSRTIAGRKKIAGITSEVDFRFNNPNRSEELTIISFKLAEKCVSGLILGEKPGTHVLLGFYNTILGSLQPKFLKSHYLESVENFSNQLKISKMSNVDRIQTYFFLIGLKLYLGESELSKAFMHELSELYSGKNESEISEEEKIWLQRVSIVWKNGVDSEFNRTLEF